MIFAKTAQAKGRIERLLNTLQSRLPVEFSKRGIRTLTEANLFLEKEYRTLFNQKFVVEPEASSIFTLLSGQTDIDSILCVKHTRKTDAAGKVSFKNRCFQILGNGFPIINARREITVLISPRFGIRVKYNGQVYDTIRYLKPQNKNANMKVPKKVKSIVEPHLQLCHSSRELKAIW